MAHDDRAEFHNETEANAMGEIAADSAETIKETNRRQARSSFCKTTHTNNNDIHIIVNHCTHCIDAKEKTKATNGKSEKC